MADITTDQNYPSVTLAITKADGTAASVDGVPVWASSDATVLAVTPSADGMSAVVDTVAPGTGRITVTADADLGAGVKTITGVSEDINVTLGASSMASVMTLSLGTATDKTSGP
ncbi:MAG: hypothetical protein V4491_02535 [Pseudomonadota bacterium]